MPNLYGFPIVCSACGLPWQSCACSADASQADSYVHALPVDGACPCCGLKREKWTGRTKFASSDDKVTCPGVQRDGVSIRIETLGGTSPPFTVTITPSVQQRLDWSTWRCSGCAATSPDLCQCWVRPREPRAPAATPEPSGGLTGGLAIRAAVLRVLDAAIERGDEIDAHFGEDLDEDRTGEFVRRRPSARRSIRIAMIGKPEPWGAR